jgi:O-antigen/teichoic acid export membrane protein
MMALVIVTGTGDPANLSLYLWLGAVFLFSPLRCTEIWFQTQVRSQLTVIAGSAGVILSAILKIYLILKGAALPLFAAAIFLETLITIILLLGFYGKKVGTFTDWTIDWKLSRQLLSDSWPLLLSGIAVTVYMQIDQVMLGLLLDEEAVGHYSAAIRISTVWYFIPMMLATSLFPAIVQARADSEAQYRSRLRQYFELNAFVAYLITVPLAIGAYWLVPLLFGQSYGQASLILSVHIWSLLFVFLGVARSEALLVEEQYRFVMISTLSGAVLNIVLNLLLIPSLGGVGAAVATLVAQSFASVGACFAYSPVRPIGLALVKAAVFPFSFISDLTRRQ